MTKTKTKTMTGKISYMPPPLICLDYKDYFHDKRFDKCSFIT